VKLFSAWGPSPDQVCVTFLGGEPVFPKSRLAVRQVGALAERGESTETILADSPYLTARDVEFEKLFARAYPRVGRPRERLRARPAPKRFFLWTVALDLRHRHD
jgi:uncharacterized protein (DUF433 family)